MKLSFKSEEELKTFSKKTLNFFPVDLPCKIVKRVLQAEGNMSETDIYIKKKEY